MIVRPLVFDAVRRSDPALLELVPKEEKNNLVKMLANITEAVISDLFPKPFLFLCVWCCYVILGDDTLPLFCKVVVNLDEESDLPTAGKIRYLVRTSMILSQTR